MLTATLMVAAPAAFVVWRFCRNVEFCRRSVGFFRRISSWEFWPWWAAYLPVVPYFLFLAAKHRSFTLFTLANPGIESGGFAGESKAEILRKLSTVPEAVAAFHVVQSAGEAAGHVSTYPVVLKPDVGERGSGVAIVRSEQELHEYAWASKTVLQRYVPGCEFGVYYVRYPNEASGKVTSITEKQFAKIVGDGVRTVRELILADPRAVCLADTYMRSCKAPLDSVPPRGHAAPLGEIGAHSLGTIFLDGIRHHTEALSIRVDQIAKAHDGFYLGRFDVRAPSPEAFQRGEFLVIELNGVSAEPTHIYDPAVRWTEAYRAMFTQWRQAFEIGAMNRARGAQPMTITALLQTIQRHRRRPQAG